MRGAPALVAAFSLAASGAVRAEGVDLRVRQLPPRPIERLAMRAPAKKPDRRSAPAASGTPMRRVRQPSGGGRRAASTLGVAARDAALPPPPLTDQVIFRFRFGLGLAGGELATGRGGEVRPTLAGARLDEARDQYESLRIYGFGDAVIGSRGLVAPNLSSYLAAQFRFEHPVTEDSTALPSIYDDEAIDPILIRSGYAQVDGADRGALINHLSVRAGRQFQYGIAIAHFDGLTLAYETPAVSLSTFAGERVDLYDSDVARASNPLVGADLRVNLFALRRWPLVLSSSWLYFADHSHLENGVALRWSEDISVGGSIRTRDGAAARQRLDLRARISEVSTLSAELSHQSEGDFLYDLLLGRGEGADRGDATESRSYLHIGPPVARTLLSLRAGTVLLQNIDLLLRAAAALQHPGADAGSAFGRSYLEGGGGLELRVLRSLRIGSSLSGRRYRLDTAEVDALVAGAPDPLALAPGTIGVRSFIEAGVSVRYALAARRFNASGELYTRSYEIQSPYLDAAERARDSRSGGRFEVEGWAGPRLRLKGEYDVSIGRIAPAPELLSVKTLRVVLEGSF